MYVQWARRQALYCVCWEIGALKKKSRNRIIKDVSVRPVIAWDVTSPLQLEQYRIERGRSAARRCFTAPCAIKPRRKFASVNEGPRITVSKRRRQETFLGSFSSFLFNAMAENYHFCRRVIGLTRVVSVALQRIVCSFLCSAGRKKPKQARIYR